MASQWIAAIKAAHPGAALAAVAAPVKPGVPSPREEGWNAGLFSTLAGADAVTMHEYTDTQITPPGVFSAADVPVLLGAPFYWVGAIAEATARLPLGLDVWVTEFNLKDASVTGVCGTWAHGLYLAAEAVLLAVSPVARVALAVPWEFLGDGSMGSLFATTTGFDFAGSPNPGLATTPYNRTAAGFTLGALGAASHNRTAAQALSFEYNPRAEGAKGFTYETLLGVVFTASDAATPPGAVLLNLGPCGNCTADAASSANFSSYVTFYAAPQDAVNADAVVKTAGGALPPTGAAVPLPPYSITVLVA